MIAKTPKGRKVEVEIISESGTARLQNGQIRYGGIKVSWWSEGGTGTSSLAEALKKADDFIDENELCER